MLINCDESFMLNKTNIILYKMNLTNCKWLFALREKLLIKSIKIDI